MHSNISFCVWEPEPQGVYYSPHNDDTDHPGKNKDFWYFYIGNDVTIGIGRYLASEETEAAFLRKLAADATELAEKIEKRRADRGMTPITMEGLDQ